MTVKVGHFSVNVDPGVTYTEIAWKVSTGCWEPQQAVDEDPVMTTVLGPGSNVASEVNFADPNIKGSLNKSADFESSKAFQ